MDLHQLMYFQTVARHEHISRAAAELHIAQPSLSKVIARLEKDLGVHLFDREGRGIKLNQYGERFLRTVNKIFFELEDVQRELLDLSARKRSEISIALNVQSFIPNLLESFLAQNPQISFQFEINSTAEIQRQLKNGHVDFCIFSPPIEGSGIECIPLITEEIFLIVPQGHRLADRGTISLTEAAQEPFISFKKGYAARDLTEQLCRQAGFTPSIVFEGDITSSLTDLVNVGLGVALHPMHKWLVQTKKLPVALHIKEPVCVRTTGLSFVKDRYMSQTAKQFMEYVVKYFLTM